MPGALAAGAQLTSAAFYRSEASRYRLLAADANQQQSGEFRRKAAECDDLADDLDGQWTGPTSDGRHIAWPLLRGGRR
jgi:hypothetical protein